MLKNWAKKLIYGIALTMMATCVVGVFLENASFGTVSAARYNGNQDKREQSKDNRDYSAAELAELSVSVLERTSNQIGRELKGLKSDYTGAVGIMIRPAPGPITSPYSKTKVHPVFGAVRPHNGTDIGAPYGHEIYAADGGIVIYAGWRDNYGWTTILDHGNGLATVYAHQSKLLAEVGVEVAQGDVIGYVGSTGYSTGPHLHFEVRRDGELRDPYHYIPY